MKDINVLKEERAHKMRSAEDIVKKAQKEDRELSKEEQSTIDAYFAESEQIDREIKSLDAHFAAVADVERRMEGLHAVETRRSTPEPPANSTVKPERAQITTGPRYGRLEAFQGPRAEENAFRAGQWIRANFFGDHAARRFCVEQGLGLEQRAMSEGVNILGGALVPDELASAVIDLRNTYGAFRQSTRIVPMGRDVMTIPRSTGRSTAYFTAEAVAAQESTPTWNQVNLVAKKLSSLILLSRELADDAIIDLADWVARDMAWAFAKKEDECAFAGDGTATYGSIMGVLAKVIDGTHTVSAVNAVTGHDLFSEVDTVDLTTLMSKCPAYARPNAKWYASPVAQDVVFTHLQAFAGGNTVQTLAGPVEPRFLGYPIVVSPAMPTSVGTLVNLAMLLFGDMSLASSLGERTGFTLRVSTEYKFAEDQIALLASERIDINIHDLGDATDAGPIVALIGA